MKKFLRIFSYKKDIASIGIGALMVFIALILVAAMAASVIIQTAGTLERKSLETGSQTTSEVGTGIKITDVEAQYTERCMAYNKTTGIIWAFNGSSDESQVTDLDSLKGWYNYTRIHNMTISITPWAGSTDIDLSNAIVEISNSSVKCLLTYGNSSAFSTTISASGVFSTGSSGVAHVADGVFNLKPNEFGIIVLEDADSSISSTNPVMNSNDRVMLTVNSSACFWGISTNTNIWGNVIIEEGASALFAFRTPASMIDTVYDLF